MMAGSAAIMTGDASFPLFYPQEALDAIQWHEFPCARTGAVGGEEVHHLYCHVQTTFPPNRVETAEHLSKLTDQTTIVREQITKSDKQALRTLFKEYSDCYWR